MSRTCKACGKALATKNIIGFCKVCAPCHRAEWLDPARLVMGRKCMACREKRIDPNNASGLCRSCARKAFFARARQAMDSRSAAIVNQDGFRQAAEQGSEALLRRQWAAGQVFVGPWGAPT